MATNTKIAVFEIHMKIPHGFQKYSIRFIKLLSASIQPPAPIGGSCLSAGQPTILLHPFSKHHQEGWVLLEIVPFAHAGSVLLF